MTTTERASLSTSIFRGAISFMVVSLAGFSVWAFAGGWFYRNVGEAGLYVATTVVFIGLAGILMHPLLLGPRRMARFYAAFVPAFLLYAVVWSVCWFALKTGDGEWLGSLLGSAAFAFVLGKMLKSTNGLLQVIAVMFAAHSAGYFLGGFAYASLRPPPEFLSGLSRSQLSLLAKMLWGFFYGLGFGVGIGYAFYIFQSKNAAPSAAQAV